MNKRLQSFILFVLIISVLNGALFNRVGPKIAEKPYLTMVFNAISSVLFKKQMDNDHALLYSKRFVPNNLPPNQLLSFEKEYNKYYQNLVLKNQFGETAEVKSKIVFYFKNGALSKAFKMLLIKPPCEFTIV